MSMLSLVATFEVTGIPGSATSDSMDILVSNGSGHHDLPVSVSITGTCLVPTVAPCVHYTANPCPGASAGGPPQPTAGVPQSPAVIPAAPAGNTPPPATAQPLAATGLNVRPLLEAGL